MVALECSGSGSVYSYTTYSCSYNAYTGFSSCVSNNVPVGAPACSFISNYCSYCKRCNQTCTGGYSGCTIAYDCPGGPPCGIGYAWLSGGCTTCDDSVCKTGTTTYTQACGSETRYYSCTNECGGTKTWTSTATCRECETENACGYTYWDCKATTCNECEDCSPRCGQALDCGGSCSSADDGKPAAISCSSPSGGVTVSGSVAMSWSTGDSLTDGYNLEAYKTSTDELEWIEFGIGKSAGEMLTNRLNALKRQALLFVPKTEFLVFSEKTMRSAISM